ncbi:hypothetical protein N5O88_10005 [Pseudomonas sp. GD03721]|nr:MULTISPECIES: hypothetical protein [unclassified Pseudomonas]MDH1440402.1 hypothetical protein [Pseudomonas sp. GD03722]WGG03510.1 hypothetical protein N5O88_10005 [Pseudomonas sp. GD03721]WGG07678.1 hypothetical protein N5O87_10015 [Pseudomonas sp. GD03919]
MKNHDDLEDEEIFARTLDLFLLATEAPDEPDHADNLLDWLSENPRHIAALHELGRLLEMTREALASVRDHYNTSKWIADLIHRSPRQSGPLRSYSTIGTKH